MEMQKAPCTNCDEQRAAGSAAVPPSAAVGTHAVRLSTDELALYRYGHEQGIAAGLEAAAAQVTTAREKFGDYVAAAVAALPEDQREPMAKAYEPWLAAFDQIAAAIATAARAKRSAPDRAGERLMAKRATRVESQPAAPVRQPLSVRVVRAMLRAALDTLGDGR